jgi:hypothetical protein
MTDIVAIILATPLFPNTGSGWIELAIWAVAAGPLYAVYRFLRSRQ